MDKTNLTAVEQVMYATINQQASQAYNDVRLLSHNLLPDELARQGLDVALRSLVDRMNRNTPVRFRLTGTSDLPRLDRQTEFELYSICLELINNTIKHAQATEGHIDLTQENGTLHLMTSDNGSGLNAHRTDGRGLHNVAARVDSLGGTWGVNSTPDGGVQHRIAVPTRMLASQQTGLQDGIRTLTSVFAIFAQTTNVMVQAPPPVFPQTLDEFLDWEPTDGFKYEWNDGQLIRFSGMKKKQYYIYNILSKLFYEKGYHTGGTLMAEPDVMLTAIQMRRPDIAYFTDEQVEQGRKGEDVIPAFVVEVLSETDQAYRIEEKIAEYFKAGVEVVWNIIPEHEVVYVYTSRKNVTICLEDDICSAAPVLPDFTISINALFAQPTA